MDHCEDIRRDLGWGELKEVKELLGVLAYKEKVDQDMLESEELDGVLDDGVTGLQEEKEENERKEGKR